MKILHWEGKEQNSGDDVGGGTNICYAYRHFKDKTVY